MKIRRNYTMAINHFTNVAKFGDSLNLINQPLSNVVECNLSELKHNIKLLRRKGYTIVLCKSKFFKNTIKII